MSVNTQFLCRDSTGLLLNVAPGKPDPTQSYTAEEEGSRKRVLHTKFQGGDNWFRGINFLRLRVGKNHPPEFAEERKIEKIFSQLKKDNVQAIKKEYILDPSTVAEPSVPEFFYQFGRVGPINIKIFYNELAKPLGFGQSLKSTIDAFLASGESNFGEYTYKRDKNILMERAVDKARFEAIRDCYLKFFESFSIDVARFYEDDLRRDPEKITAFDGKKSYHELSTEKQISFLQCAARRVSIDKFQLKVSKWRPSDKISVLINELAVNGPLCIGATYGRHTYLACGEKPFKLKDQLGGRDIYGWKKTSQTYTPTLHTKLLVGAVQGKEGEFVYYIDPEDPSDPEQPEKQPIYITSYSKMTKEILDIEGVLRPESASGHAVYRG